MNPSFLAVAVAITLASASAFAAPSSITQCAPPIPQRTALHATTKSRRQLLHNAFAGGAAFSAFLFSRSPSPANAVVDASSYATTIEKNTNALSQSLGHAIISIDAMNAQARRLGSSPASSHRLAVLDGIDAQARRLRRDLDRSLALLDEIKGQAKEITIGDEGGGYSLAMKNVAHASSVLEGIVSQSKRLQGVSTAARSTDDQIIYMLSILDGLNAQVRRLDIGETLGVLDELNAKAATALL